jgi:hypothetical protein
MFDDTRIKKYIYRLLSGKAYLKIDDKFIIYTPPNVDILHQAEFFYEEKYFEGLASGFISVEDSYDLALSKKLITKEELIDIEKLPEKIDDIKVDYFFAYQQKSEYSMKVLKKTIEGLRRKLNKLLNKKNAFYNVTTDCWADYNTKLWMIPQLIYDSNMNKITSDSFVFINKVYNNLEQIPSDYYRKIARHQEWSLYWGCKDTIFSGRGILNEEQMTIINTSKMFDAIQQNPNCPDKEVLDDSDLLDGWLINNSRKREGDIAKRDIDKQLDRAGVKGGNIFVVAKDAEDAKRINNMNNQANKIVAKNFLGKMNEKAKK